jgi:hypothetical protein
VEGIAAAIGKSKAEVALAASDPALEEAVHSYLAGRLADAVYEPNKIDQTR